MFRPGSAEPIGGVARFQSLVNYYRESPRFAGQPNIFTLFSGDAFNPSLESTVTKGTHMVPFLNKIGTDVACVGVRTPDGLVESMNIADMGRIMTWTLESNSCTTLPVNAISLGSWPMYSTLLLDMEFRSRIAERPVY